MPEPTVPQPLSLADRALLIGLIITQMQGETDNTLLITLSASTGAVQQAIPSHLCARIAALYAAWKVEAERHGHAHAAQIERYQRQIDHWSEAALRAA